MVEKGGELRGIGRGIGRGEELRGEKGREGTESVRAEVRAGEQ